MDINDDILLNNEGCPILPEIAPLDPVDLFPTYHDITAISDCIEKLSIYVNTQSLRVEIEKIKR